jgi:hypothetical protein
VKPFRIKKDELVQKVQFNRNEHRAIYERAMDGYRKAAGDFFNEQLEKARAGKVFVTFFSEPMPEDHTDDYDVVLEGWRMTEDDEIELSVQEFRQYVKDEWGWKKEFLATSQNYLASS